MDATGLGLGKGQRGNPGTTYLVKANGTSDLDALRSAYSYGVDDISGNVLIHASIDAANNACAASLGDTIYVSPGHAETLTAAGAIALDTAGVSLIGLGNGNNRPVLTFGSSDNSATVAISANNVRMENFVAVCADDGLTNAFVVTGDNVYLDIEFQDTSSTVEAATAVRLDTANNAYLKLKYLGFTGGNAVVSAVRLDDCDNVRIDIDAFGVVSTAWVEMVDVASTNVVVNGKTYTQGVTDGSKNVVDTITGSSWGADIFDISAGAKVSGGSASPLAIDDLSAIATSITALPKCVEKLDGAVLLGNDALFTISGGPVDIIGIYGIVTTQIGAGTTNVKLTLTTTSPAATVDMSAGAVDIDADAAGTSYRHINTTAVLTPVTAGFVMKGNAFATNDTQFFAPVGTINLNSDAARAGVIAWYMRYVPLSPSSVVSAAA